MKNLMLENKPAAACVFTMPVAATVWALAVPGMMSTGTFGAGLLVAVGAGLVLFNTWRNSQATQHIGHVLQQTEAGTRHGRTMGSVGPRA